MNFSREPVSLPKVLTDFIRWKLAHKAFGYPAEASALLHYYPCVTWVLLDKDAWRRGVTDHFYELTQVKNLN